MPTAIPTRQSAALPLPLLRLLRLLLLPLLLLLAPGALAAPAQLSVETTPSGAFTLLVDGRPWLASAPSALFAAGAERALQLGNRSASAGADALGAWTAETWTGAAGGTRVEAAVRVYAARNAATFDVTLPDGARGTQRAAPNTTGWLEYGDAPPVVDFPAFAWGDALLPDLGLLTIAHDQVADAAWSWRSEGGLPPSAGRGSGPFVVYGDPRATAIAISPLTNFAAAVNFFNASAPSAWRWGPSGELTALPPGFSHRTLVVLGAEGLSSAWQAMGAALQQMNASAAAARRAAQDADLNLRALSYYTDAGDMFYAGATADELARVVKAADAPFALVQLDDWAHQSTCRVDCGGLSRWAGDEHFFPGDWANFSAEVGLPLALYLPGAGLCPGAGRKYFNVSTLEGGGGTFESPTPADAPSFFAQIMQGGLAQGMGRTLEVDFLDAGFLMVREFRESLDAYPAYFAALARAAEAAGSAVQLCMALPHHALAAATLPHLTSMRVGEDYDWPSNCDIGVTSFLPWAVGLSPSKDSFMSSNLSHFTMPPPFFQHGIGNPMSLPELNAVIAAFSTGPVGLGDGLRATNRSIVMPACDAAGRLLQPDRPLLAIDATFARADQEPRGPPNGHCKSSWMSAADNGAIWSSLTQLEEGAQTAHFVLAINVTRPWVLQRSDLWPRLDASSAYVSRHWGPAAPPCTNGSLAVASGCVALAAPGGDLPDLRSHSADASGAYGVGESPFVLLAVHEVPASGWLVWEAGKYVSLSRQRFAGVVGAPEAAGLRVALRGAAGEVVKLVALRPGAAVARGAAEEWTVVEADATIGADGLATVQFQ